MGARGVSNGLLRRMPNKAHHFPPYYIAEQSIVIIGCFAFIRKIRHKHTRDTSVCFYTVFVFDRKRAAFRIISNKFRFVNSLTFSAFFFILILSDVVRQTKKTSEKNTQ